MSVIWLKSWVEAIEFLTTVLRNSISPSGTAEEAGRDAFLLHRWVQMASVWWRSRRTACPERGEGREAQHARALCRNGDGRSGALLRRSTGESTGPAFRNRCPSG